MVRPLLVYGKKLFSLTLIFVSLLGIVYAVGLLTGFYALHWTLYTPYLIDGSLFWFLIIASIINIFPATIVGRVKTGRLWFHHYVYGFAVLVPSAVSLLIFTNVSLISLFMGNMNVTANVERFFALGGLTLVLDDLPDVSKATRLILSFMKSKAYQIRQMIHWVQFLMGTISFYIFLCVSASVAVHPNWVTLANFILIGTLLVTSLTSFASVKRKIWLKITPEESEATKGSTQQLA
jgi:hypothetical protein